LSLLEYTVNSEKSVIKIPSAVIAEEFNFLLNPAQSNSNFLKKIEISDLIYDIRIKSV
jgi:hypothetical protein